jgi:hypothetical protein
MRFLARFLHPRDPSASESPAAGRPEGEAPAPDGPDGESAAVRPTTTIPQAPDGVACPSCARIVSPAPVRPRKCPFCRRTIVVRRTGGRTVYLTEAAVEVFEAERRREADIAGWTARRAEWLRLAQGVGADPARVARIVGRHLAPETVAEARSLYVTAAAKVQKDAAKAGHWDVAARVGREQAAALYLDAGSPVPVPEDVLALHSRAMIAMLRSQAGTGTHAEIIGGRCCAACRGDDGKAFPIKDELRTPRLPHSGCPRGLCPCEWWLAVTPPLRKRRRSPAKTSKPAEGA